MQGHFCRVHGGMQYTQYTQHTQYTQYTQHSVRYYWLEGVVDSYAVKTTIDAYRTLAALRMRHQAVKVI